MPTVNELTEPLANICTTVPSAGDGVCVVCHGRPNPGFETCFSCEQTAGQVTLPCETVVPISLYEVPSQLHFCLRGYKDNPSASVRSKLELDVAALAARFIRDHGDCIRESTDEWDYITTVPSTSGKHGGVNPLQAAFERVPWLGKQHREVLAPSEEPPKHNIATDTGLVTIADVDGDRVLLIDDTFTSGAHAQSAVSALQLAGVSVVAIVAIGRVIKPNFSETVKEFWKAQRAVKFSFDRCCLEDRRIVHEASHR